MKNKIKIWHLTTAVLLILFVIRFDRLVELTGYACHFIILLFTDTSFVTGIVTSSSLDVCFSVLAFFLLIILLFLFRKLKPFSLPVNYISFFIILFSILTLFAPVIATTDPDFQTDIQATKFLSPFSVKEYIEQPVVKQNDQQSLKEREYEFIHSIDEIQRNPVFGDSIKISNVINVWNNNKVSEFPIVTGYAKPEIKRRIFLFGTDEYGRDIFSRIVYGTRLAFVIGFGSVIISMLVGIFLGYLAGFYGSFLNSVLGRITDMFLSFPVIFLIILIISLFGNSIPAIIFVLGFSGWMSLFKVVRGEVISIKKTNFITTAKQLGYSDSRVLVKEILPNIIAPVLVNLILQFGNVIIAEAALSYLGLGIGGKYPTWGSMIQEGQFYLSHAWWISFFPCVFLFLILFAVNSLGQQFIKTISRGTVQ